VTGKLEKQLTKRYSSAATLMPVIVGALLVAIVAIFIFEAPNQITTPRETGYLNTEMPTAVTAVPTATG
jgi:hypothetical protein